MKPKSFLDAIENRKQLKGKDGSGQTTPQNDGQVSPPSEGVDMEKRGVDNGKVKVFRPYTFAVAAIVSIGGFIFGYGMQFTFLATFCIADVLQTPVRSPASSKCPTSSGDSTTRAILPTPLLSAMPSPERLSVCCRLVPCLALSSPHPSQTSLVERSASSSGISCFVLV